MSATATAWATAACLTGSTGGLVSPAPTPEPVEVTRYRCPKHECGTLSETERGARHHATLAHGPELTKATMACLNCRETFIAKPRRMDSARFCSHDCQTEAGSEATEPEVVSPPATPIETTVRRYRCPIEGCSELAESERGCQIHITHTHPNESRATFACEYCDSHFDVKASAASYTRYCSNTCRNRARRRRVVLTCEHCGDLFWTHRCRADVAQYCSPECAYFLPEMPNIRKRPPEELGLAPFGERRPPKRLPHDIPQTPTNE